MDFAVTKEQTAPESWLVRPHGEVDLYTAPAFKTELLSVIESGANSIVVDLSETTFIDSTGIGMLLGARKRLSRGVQLSIVCDDKSILRVFEITRLDQIFRIYATSSLALSANASATPKTS
jgi:anti-sigma B factor antagonist